MKSLLNALISLSFVLRALAAQTAAYPVQPPQAPQTLIFGQHWAYTADWPVTNTSTIEKLIQCESQGQNVSRPDSNGRESDGLLQFNRGPSDIMGSGTWADMEARFDFYGSPIIPSDAIHMADMAISAGMLSRWSCARIEHLE